MKQKKIPLRMCIGCMEMKPKSELVRVVREPEGNISLDPTGKKNGRGAYLCNQIECFRKARKSKGLERSLQCAIPTEVYEALEKEFSEINE